MSSPFTNGNGTSASNGATVASGAVVYDPSYNQLKHKIGRAHV